MTTRTWNGATDSFSNAADWSGGVVPVAGDIAVINAGAVTATGALPGALTITMDGTNGPTLTLSNGTLVAGTQFKANDQTAFVTLNTSGISTNAGAVRFTGQPGGEADIILLDGPGGTATSLVNTGGISIVGQQAVLLNQGSNPANDIVNNGVLSFRSGGTTGNIEFANAPIDGTGIIRLQPNTSLQLGGEVAAGQTVEFEAGSGASTLFLSDPLQFNGVITGFGSADQVRLTTTPYDTLSYTLTNGIGTFTFTNAGTLVGKVSFAGNLPETAFAAGRVPNSGVTTITTSVLNQPSRISFTDIANGVAGNEGGTPYTGPVAGLQYQYIWSSPDSVAISASVPNVFLKGGPGGDALVASSGNNVLDGGGGSNFLVGGTGTGQDTFYVDGRGGAVTWSTVVNFHPGDIAVIFGYQAGVSSMTVKAGNPNDPSTGAAGYTGLTLNSELNGPGTGVNESLTLTGVSLDTYNNHMDVAAGALVDPNTGATTPYLIINYNH